MIYADYNGSAPLHPEVIKYLNERLKSGPFGNPNAIHEIGKKLNKGLENCRKICAEALGASPEQIIFNSGASEGISTIFHSVLGTKPVAGKDLIIISKIEHAATKQAASYYSDLGYNIKKLPVKSTGEIDLDLLKDWLSEFKGKIALVAIMAANNETGVVQPYHEIAKLCQSSELPYFSDTTQLIGKQEFNFKKSGLDFACLSGHKLGALTGSGILLAKEPSTLSPLIFGGGQENNLRGGTQNYLGSETLAIALSLIKDSLKNISQLEKNKIEFELKLKTNIDDVVIIGSEVVRLPSTSLISFPGLHGQGVQIELESKNIFVTTSSACSDNEPATSQVLKAMGVDDKVGRGVIRISFGDNTNSKADYEEIYKAIMSSYEKLKKID